MARYEITIHNTKTGADRQMAVLTAKNIKEAQVTACRLYLHELEFGVEQLRTKRI
jgi:hypothetical protein